jgi:hypothetical protein
MRPPGSAPAVPATLEELLTPQWLTAALSQRFEGIEVTGVTPGPVVRRLSTNARFTIECAGGLPPGLVPALCAKGYFSDAGRPHAHLGEREATFYRDLADATGARTLRSVYADVHPETSHGVVITEDVVASGGTFLDALSPYTPDQAAASLEQLARLHAATWGDPRWAGASWLAGQLPTYLAFRGVDDVQANFAGTVGAGVPDSVKDAPRLVDAFRALATSDATSVPGPVIHGDAHVGNLFLDAAGRPGLVDWQLVQRGRWAFDVSYHIASALETADRERSERDLLVHYLVRLRANGVDPPGWDDAWTEYRKGLAYGFFLWAITLMVDPEIIRTLLQRLGTAAAAHDSFAALGI